jgi:2-succinyl-5-enolpyruvyl-6-hydroxy-3-cyclohexene-1-carboxylate synthase
MIIKQFYDDKRLIINRDNTDMIEYDRMATRDVAYKISIKEAAATASYQTSVNDALKELLFQNRISTIQYLQHVNMPFADSLLQQLQSDEAKAQQEQMLMQQMMAQQQQMTPQQQQTAEQNTQRAQQMLRPS